MSYGLLGQVLGAIYERELLAVDRLPTPSQRAGAAARLGQLREQAVRSFDLAVGAATEHPLYAAAQRAFYGQRLEEATALASLAIAASPGLYEALRLQAEVDLRRARAEQDLGRSDEALHTLASAKPLLTRATVIARSDAEIALAACRVASAEAAILPLRGRSPAAAVTEAILACDQALVADPELTEAYAQKMFAYEFGAYDLLDHGGDPSAALAAGLVAGKAAIALQPSGDGAYAQSASLLRVRATWEADHGQDAAATLQEAIALATRARDLNPRNAYAWHQLGRTYGDLARHRRATGVRDDESLERAIAALEQALAIDDKYMWAANELGRALQDTAAVAREAGRPWRPAVTRCTTLMRQFLALSPRAQTSRLRLGLCLATAAALAVEAGEDVGSFADDAIAELGRALELRPSDRVALRYRGRAHAARAHVAQVSGDDPRPDWTEARADAERALAVKPDYPEPRLDEAEVDRREALWLLGRGDARAALERTAAGRARVADAAKIVDRGATVPLAMANLWLVEGDALAALGRSPDPAWARADDELARAAGRSPAEIPAAKKLAGELASRRKR